jgi:hypothetical protein
LKRSLDSVIKGKSEVIERVRVAIDSTAQEHVRVALERASRGTLDERAIEAASATRVRVGE